jgi:hypothetical protein
LKKRLSALENPRVFRVVCQEMETKHVFHSVTEIWFAEAEMRTTSATNGSPTSYTRSCKAWLTVKINYVIIHCYYCYCLLQIIKRIIVKTNSYNTVRYVLDHNPALFRFHLKFLYQRPKCTWQNYISFCATTTPGLMQHLCGTGDLHSFFVALTWLFSCHFNVCHFFFLRSTEDWNQGLVHAR